MDGRRERIPRNGEIQKKKNETGDERGRGLGLEPVESQLVDGTTLMAGVVDIGAVDVGDRSERGLRAREREAGNEKTDEELAPVHGHVLAEASRGMNTFAGWAEPTTFTSFSPSFASLTRYSSSVEGGASKKKMRPGRPFASRNER